MTLVFSGAWIADGTEAVRRATVVLRDGRIASLLPPSAPVEVPARVVDASGYVITPGLIDVHTHMFLTGEGDLEGYERELLKESLPLRTLRGSAHARRMLERGFTTIRDVCTEGAGYADVALRDAIAAGLVQGPRVVPSGPGIGITGGYLPMGMAPGVCTPSGCTLCDSPDAARLEVRRQVSHGVSWIKVFADWPCSGPLPGPAVVRPTFTTAELEAIVDEARRHGRRVAAHATSDAGARHAVLCGAASIEHLGTLSRETLDLAAARGVFLVPTLTVSEFSVRHPRASLAAGVDPAIEQIARDLAQRRYDEIAAAFGHALAAGVRIASGSDVGAFPHAHEPVTEIRLMVELGMSPSAALRAATGEAAALLGLDVGVLREGAVADLCVFPTEKGDDVPDLTRAITSAPPSWVLQVGRIVREPR